MFKAVRGGQVVAVKIFHEHNRRGAPGSPAAQRCMAQGRDDLRREISLLRSLHDRNIVNFVGAAIWVRRGLRCRGVHRLAALPRCCHCAAGRSFMALLREPVVCGSAMPLSDHAALLDKAILDIVAFSQVWHFS